jgi:iron(III) transport system substrate-binding protein
MAFAPADTDFQPIVTSVVAAYGKTATLNWLQKMKANAGSDVYPDDETVEASVNEGRVAFGVINEYYWLRFHRGFGGNHTDIAFFAPHDPGYVLFVSGAATLAHSKHQAAAQRFLAFLTTKKAQEIVAQYGIEYPLAAPALGTSELGRSFRRLSPTPLSVGRLGDGSLAIDLLRQVGLL